MNSFAAALSFFSLVDFFNKNRTLLFFRSMMIIGKIKFKFLCFYVNIDLISLNISGSISTSSSLLSILLTLLWSLTYFLHKFLSGICMKNRNNCPYIVSVRIFIWLYFRKVNDFVLKFFNIRPVLPHSEFFVLRSDYSFCIIGMKYLFLL